MISHLRSLPALALSVSLIGIGAAFPQQASATLLNGLVSMCVTTDFSSNVGLPNSRCTPPPGGTTILNAPNTEFPGITPFGAIDFTVDADLGVENGIDFIVLSVGAGSFGTPNLFWNFAFPQVTSDITMITQVTGPTGPEAPMIFANGRQIALTTPSIGAPQSFRFELSTMAPPGGSLPAPGVAWLLLPGLVVAWRRFRTR